MLKPARQIYDWAAQKVHSPFAPLWFGLIFLLEIILFIPLDALLILFCMEKKEQRYLYATIAAIASTISGVVGFLAGYLLWDIIGPFVIEHLISPQFFERLLTQYTHYQNWAVLIGSFLPIPFKAIALSAGFFQLALLPFILCVFAARVIRFFSIALMMQLWGARLKAFIDRHFNRIVIAFGAKIALTISFFWALGS